MCRAPRDQVSPAARRGPVGWGPQGTSAVRAAALILLALVTAFLSALLENVTTVILMVPATFLIADALDTSPMPFLLAQVVSSMLASNIGGAATLTGDTPNILIGSAADLSLADFDVNMTPMALISLPVVLGILFLMFRKDLTGGDGAEGVIANMGAAGSIRDGVLPRNSHYPRPRVPSLLPARALHLKAASIALFGAATLMLYFGVNVEEVLREVEWPALIFFVGLFALVGGLKMTGLVGSIGETIAGGGGGTSAVTAVMVILGSGVASGILDNISFTATMIPVIQDLAKAEEPSEAEVRALWAVAGPRRGLRRQPDPYRRLGKRRRRRHERAGGRSRS